MFTRILIVLYLIYKQVFSLVIFNIIKLNNIINYCIPISLYIVVCLIYNLVGLFVEYFLCIM